MKDSILIHYQDPNIDQILLHLSKKNYNNLFFKHESPHEPPKSSPPSPKLSTSQRSSPPSPKLSTSQKSPRSQSTKSETSTPSATLPASIASMKSETSTPSTIPVSIPSMKSETSTPSSLKPSRKSSTKSSLSSPLNFNYDECMEKERNRQLILENEDINSIEEMAKKYCSRLESEHKHFKVWFNIKTFL